MAWLRIWASLTVFALTIVSLPPAATASSSARSRLPVASEPPTFNSQLSRCPAPCAGKHSEQWTVYPSFDRLSICDQPMLFDFAIRTPIDGKSNTAVVRACTNSQSSPSSDIQENEKNSDDFCIASTSKSQVSLTLHKKDSITTTTSRISFLRALDNIKSYFSKYTSEYSCNGDYDLIMTYFNETIVGIYAGWALGKTTIPALVDELAGNSKLSDDTLADRFLAQICGGGRGEAHIAGLVMGNAKDIDYIQSTLIAWNDGRCVDVHHKRTGASTWTQDFNIQETSRQISPRNDPNSAFLLPSSSPIKRAATENGYCTTQTVSDGNTCPDLAKACKISLSDLYKYNNAGNGQDWCKKIQSGKKVCCSAGSLKPLPQTDGTCYTYKVKAGDDCSKIGLPWGLTIKDVASFNDKTTWGWRGCGSLDIGLNICLSKGNPPMPAPVANALCGPQKPGTESKGKIKDAADLAELNPCPLNSCCNIWGQCGIDPSFCTEAPGPLGNPGTSPPGVNGCISNCGTEIANNNAPVSNGYIRVGYYEAFNWDRPCLRQRAEWSNTMNYTNIHWAFGDIGKDQSIFINDTNEQWKGFMGIKGVKKIVSFGGWGVSTDQSTYQILRNAMDTKFRDRFVKNIVEFVNKTGIDGVDFDWEYPGASDIPGIPKGLSSDAPNYLATLRALRAALPLKYSISIAAPASYWYLKPFPIGDMAKLLDYVVFMSYDLHGQWDVGNEWAMGGCPAGNCLRSHINETEVMFALAMITKAGVYADKIVVGESSYGRSFHMSNAGCTGPQCTFTGKIGGSEAAKGRCTNTRGYLANAEIYEIIAKSPPGSIKTWFDQDTASDYLVYNGTEWVAYMSDKTKMARRKKWQNLNFRGTVDWAVDLQNFTIADRVGPRGDYNKSACINLFDGMIWNWANPAIEAPAGCTNLLEPSPLPSKVTLTAYTTITLVSGTSLSSTIVSAPFTVSEVPYQPFTFGPSDFKSGKPITYHPVPRLTPDPITIRIPHGWTSIAPGQLSTSLPPQSTIIGGPDNTTTSTSSNDGGGLLLPITWEPTNSYRLPSIITPKPPAPSQIPEDDGHPIPGPPPGGVTDCRDNSCTKGATCDGEECTRGGDCIGANCVGGGGCVGPKCIRGGDCIGPKCHEGGPCKGEDCDSGGSCSGAGCYSGGDCIGPSCNKGGGCAKLKLGDCLTGGCHGNYCFGSSDCLGGQCERITIKPPTGNPSPGPLDSPPDIPKPTCLVNCPELPPCANGGSSCNSPCQLEGCPPDRQPTEKACTTLKTGRDCTEFVSSTKVKVSPTTSWSTTTRTHCEKSLDCDPIDMTTTTTISTSESLEPYYAMTQLWDQRANVSISPDDISFVHSQYTEWKSEIEYRHRPQPTIQPKPKTAACTIYDEFFAYRFHIYNISGWADDGGVELQNQESGCGALTQWDWESANKDHLARTSFFLPFFIKDGCVERAIVSAGGPDISCSGGGTALPIDGRGDDGDPWT